MANWIAEATKNKGALHREMGVPEGEKIPKESLKKKLAIVEAKETKSPKDAKTERRIHLALTLGAMHHPGNKELVASAAKARQEERKEEA